MVYLDNSDLTSLTSHKKLPFFAAHAPAPALCPLTVDARNTVLKRIVFLLLGLICICLPATQMFSMLPEFCLGSIFFSIFVAASVFAGSALIIDAVATEDQMWNFRNGTLYLNRQSLWFNQMELIVSKDVFQITVRKVEWHFWSSTYRVALYLKNGAVFETPDYSEIAAQKLAVQFCSALNFVEETD